MIKKNIKIYVSIMMILVMVFALSACAAKTAEAKPAEEQAAAADQKPAEEQKAAEKIAELKEKGKIVLGTSADYPPYEFHKEIDGKDNIVGFDIDIAKAIAADLGVELEIKDMKFEGLLAALVAEDIDFIVAGMVPTEERKQSVDFSISYYQAEQKMLVKAENADKVKTVEDLKGKVIGAQKSTIQEEIANTKIEASEVKALSKITDLVLELQNDKVFGVVLVGPVADAYAKQNPAVAVPELSFGREDGVAVAVNKGNEDLVEAINTTLDKLMKDGSVDKFIGEATLLSEQ
ncbi:MAG TPA: transporter substrate-binding domain-containing protein [Clostridia bacterium]|nr:transporter substrate-binding domain-containing protein [Clostridia bacterium]